MQVTWMVANSTNGGGDSHTLHGPNPQTHYLIPDLHWLMTYTVLVHASNRVGRGKDSEEMNITTDATGTACVVGCVRFHCHKMETTSIHFTTVTSYMRYTMYVILPSPFPPFPLFPSLFSSFFLDSSTSFFFSSHPSFLFSSSFLDSFTPSLFSSTPSLFPSPPLLFSFTLSSCSFLDASLRSSSLLSSLLLPVPAAPEEVTHMDLAPTSVQVTWRLSANDGGAPITSVRVFYRARNQTWEEAGFIDTVSLDSSSLRVIGLRDDTQYQLRVVAENRMGEKWCLL